MDNTKKFNPVVDKIIAYEGGELSDSEILNLFAILIKNGMAWTLQGSYSRFAISLIEKGYIDNKGNIIRDI